VVHPPLLPAAESGTGNLEACLPEEGTGDHRRRAEEVGRAVRLGGGAVLRGRRWDREDLVGKGRVGGRLVLLWVRGLVG
jgi:hypothetical protein